MEKFVALLKWGEGVIPQLLLNGFAGKGGTIVPRWIPSALRVVKEEDRWYHMKTESRKMQDFG